MFHDNSYEQIFAEYILIIEIIIFVLIGLSWYFADQKQFSNHKQVVQIMFIGQTILSIIMILRMLTSEYARQFVMHAFAGILIYFLILYTYLLMDKKIPSFLAIPRKYRKKLMQVTAILWAIAVVSGFLSFLLIPD